MSDRIVRSPFVPDTLDVVDESVGESLWRSLEENGPKLALIEVGTGLSVTYDQLKNRASLVAKRLLARGCQRGDVIAIFSPNSIAYLVIQVAVLRIGAAAAGINPLLKVDELRRHLKVCEPKFVFTTDALVDEVLKATTENTIQGILLSGSVRPGCVDIEAEPNTVDEHLLSLPSFASLDIQPDDMAILSFSSGTTGPQKGVILSHRNIQYAFAMGRHPMTGIAVVPTQVSFAPLTHVTGLVFLYYNVLAGSTIHLMIKFDIEDFLHIIDENKIDFTLTVPAVAVMMLKSAASEKYRLNIKDMIVCSASLSAEAEEELMSKYPGLSVRQAYGMTEAPALACVVPFEADKEKRLRKPGSVGVPAASVQFKVIDINTGEALGPNEKGEICMKSPLVTPGYFNNPEATANTIDKDGWIHTGDVGFYDEDSYFFIVDRLKELIKYNSYQVAPSELEYVLLSHTQVMDAGVVGLPDPSAGELPLAFVVRKPGATVTESELQQFVDEKVAPYKKLRGGVRFLSAIPKTPSGKILRRDLKAAAVVNGK
jgi:acyl-CoA synthetase (AMP-forming)/AMP-acid ligase II